MLLKTVLVIVLMVLAITLAPLHGAFGFLGVSVFLLFMKANRIKPEKDFKSKKDFDFKKN